MKHTSKLVLSLVLVIVFLLACGALGSIFFVGSWLQTYSAFTTKTLVAEVALSEMKSDEDGAYFEVTYTPYAQQQSALSTLLDNKANNTTIKQESQTFKIYGDSVHVGGPVIKFYDNLILLNFHSVYKIGVIYGRYDFDNKAEQSRKVQSSFELNGGLDSTWKDIMQNQQRFPYDTLVDYSQLSDPGIPVQSKPSNYKLYINDNGFAFE